MQALERGARFSCALDRICCAHRRASVGSLGLADQSFRLDGGSRRYGAVRLRCAFGRGLRREWTWRRVGIGVALAVLLVAISFAVFRPVFNSCTKAMCHYDLGLYYLKMIRWTEGFPIVPGLVNVQEHLAFNQSAFLVISLVDSLVPNRWGLLLVGGFLPWLGLTLSAFALARLAAFKLRANENPDTH